MTSLPDRPDLHQLRIQAKELKRAIKAGEQEALDRVLASHPKFAGRGAARMEGWTFTLRDAQVMIARELGFDSWKVLLTAVEGAPRWDSSVSFDISRRAFAEAQGLRHGFCTDSHFLLACLKPSAPTASSEILNELGLSYEQVRERVAKWDRPRRKGSNTSSTPTYQLVLGWAQGIAIGMGASGFNDQHVLLALVYGDPGGESMLTSFDIDPDEVVARLRDRGVPTPRLQPPAAPVPLGPYGPWVYFPLEKWSAVTQELNKNYPPGTGHWGTNRSKWKQGPGT
ncbi:MAG: Clp protease N-terminal domain-containing protein [Acidimicrobiia bacterium]